MNEIKIKPLSVNEAWAGRRFKSEKYKKFQFELINKIQKLQLPKGDILAFYEFGFSNKASDWDNPIKPIQDILQRKLKFNDSRIYLGLGHKVIVKKGEEYIKYSFTEYTEDKINKIKDII